MITRTLKEIKDKIEALENLFNNNEYWKKLEVMVAAEGERATGNKKLPKVAPKKK